MVGRVVLAASLLAAALAGCASGGGEADLALAGPQATDTTGVIRGVVVDDAIRPVAGATVTVRGAGAEQAGTTDANGTFGFAGLVPGTWFVTAAKRAYTEAQQSVEVEAGVGLPPITKLLLVHVPGEAPFHTEVKVEAYVQCIVPGANLCAIANLYPCAVAGLCDPIVDDSSYIVLHDHLVAVGRVPDWLQTEVVWESTQSLSPALAIRYSAHSPDDGAGVDERQGSVEGRSPLLIQMGNATLAEWETGTKEGISHEFFGHMDETSAIGSVGFVVNQRVTFFSHAFYGYVPPAGWRFSVDGGVPSPPS